MHALVIATGNKGKIREINDILAVMGLAEEYGAVAYSELIAPFEIEEGGITFQANALIKVRAVYEKLGRKDVVVLSDDSGISVPALGGIPGIYSARFAGEGASDADNLGKLSRMIGEAGLEATPAYYTACIVLLGPLGEATAHGWMHGMALASPRGEGGFGYDPMFIPEGYTQTLGELDDTLKSRISHRSKALMLALRLLRTVA